MKKFLKILFGCFAILVLAVAVIFLQLRNIVPKLERNPTALTLDTEFETDTERAAWNILDTQTTMFFDVDGDGFWEETHWITPQGAFLALDRNGNNHIDSRKELFFSDKEDKAFSRLAALDSPSESGNGDGVLNAADGQWKNLVLWRQPGSKLVSMEEVGISELSFFSRPMTLAHANGNYTVAFSALKAQGKTSSLVEVRFNANYVNSFYVGDDVLQIPEVSAEIKGMPQSRGIGKLKPLRTSMMENPALAAKMREMVDVNPADCAKIDKLVYDILFLWAGVERSAISELGAISEAEKRKIMGIILDTDTRVLWGANLLTSKMDEHWDAILQMYKNRFLAQGPLRPHFRGGYYDYSNDSMNLGQNTVDEMLEGTSFIDFNYQSSDCYWQSMENILVESASVYQLEPQQMRDYVRYKKSQYLQDNLGHAQ